MDISLKNIKYAAFNSEETHCFSATVYIDGKKAFRVSNSGHGGCDDYQPCDKKTSARSVYDQVQKINKELSKTPLKPPFENLTMNLEILIGDLMNQWLEKKEVKKLLKKVSIIDNKGSVLSYKIPMAKYVADKTKMSALIREQNPDCIFLNELTIDQAHQTIKEKTVFFGES